MLWGMPAEVFRENPRFQEGKKYVPSKSPPPAKKEAAPSNPDEDNASTKAAAGHAHSQSPDQTRQFNADQTSACCMIDCIALKCSRDCDEPC